MYIVLKYYKKLEKTHLKPFPLIIYKGLLQSGLPVFLPGYHITLLCAALC